MIKADRGDYPGAIEDYDRAIDLEPSRGYYKGFFYTSRGNLKAQQNDPIGALVDFTKALELSPKNEQAYYQRGKIKEQMGDLAGALADIQEAHRLDPKHAVIKETLMLLQSRLAGENVRSRPLKEEETSSSDSSKVKAEPGEFLFHRVMKGETLGSIAKWYSGNEEDWRELAKVNPGKDFTLQTDEIVRIPISLATQHQQQARHSTRVIPSKKPKPAEARKPAKSEPLPKVLDTGSEEPPPHFGPR